MPPFVSPFVIDLYKMGFSEVEEDQMKWVFGKKGEKKKMMISGGFYSIV